MMVPIWKWSQRTICAVALTILAADIASAAPARLGVNTNLRLGPGLNFGVIRTLSAGSIVDVIRCGPEWCNVLFRGRPGYLVARNLAGGPARGGPAPVAVVGPPPPPVVVVGPPVYYGPGPYWWGPRYYWGPRRYWRGW
jgi:hypothetical protein